MGNIGITEILIIAAVVLLLFGGGKLADMGKGLGQGIKNFKQGLKEADEIGKKPSEPEKPAEKKEATKEA
jgi:sec-independent protein translocase protein TatA